MYVFPAWDFLEEVTFEIKDEKGTGHVLSERATAALNRVSVTRSENLLMIATKKNDSKTKKRVGEVTAELTAKIKKPWTQLIDDRVKQLAEAALQLESGTGAASASTSGAPATPSQQGAPPAKKSKKSRKQ